jgi:hypothetical protein
MLEILKSWLVAKLVEVRGWVFDYCVNAEL